jgi:hypothetical protein
MSVTKGPVSARRHLVLQDAARGSVGYPDCDFFRTTDPLRTCSGRIHQRSFKTAAFLRLAHQRTLETEHKTISEFVIVVSVDFYVW